MPSLRRLMFLAPVLAMAACTVGRDGEVEGSDEDAQLENELTSNSALSRSLSFQGVVYVDANATDSTILSRVRAQTQTAFGALRTAEIGVNSRELKDVDSKTFVKTKVTMIDTSKTGDVGTPMLKVVYTYNDMAVVPKSMSRRSSLSLAVMGNRYASQSSRVLTECTDNDQHARDFASSLWYVFNPSLSSCKTAMTTEAKAIDADRKKLNDATGTKVSKLEVERLYLPTTMRLGGDKTNKGLSYPEYDRLYAGGVQKGKLVIGLVNGLIDHDHGEMADDYGYGEWMQTLREVFKTRPGFKLAKIAPQEDISTVTAGGKTYTGIKFDDVMKWTIDGTGYPAGVTWAQQGELRVAMGKKLAQHWLTFETTVSVKIGTAAATPVTLQILTYFGADSDSTPHKFAIKNSDVFLYNGHSYIGYGPLDPSRFTASDFPSSYQILFIDGCVSYNYYHRDYVPLKQGGTKNLDLITNGLEAPSWRSGYALGRFLARLLDGTQASYKDLLTAASATDSLRVVDNELDNLYSPTKTPIVVK